MATFNELTANLRNVIEQMTAACEQEYVDLAKKLMEKHGMDMAVPFYKNDEAKTDAAMADLKGCAIAEMLRNRSRWSGGHASYNNICEGIRSEVAEKVYNSPYSIFMSARGE